MLKQKEDSDFIMGTSPRSPANRGKTDTENSTPSERGVKRLIYFYFIFKLVGAW